MVNFLETELVVERSLACGSRVREANLALEFRRSVEVIVEATCGLVGPPLAPSSDQNPNPSLHAWLSVLHTTQGSYRCGYLPPSPFKEVEQKWSCCQPEEHWRARQ